MLNLDLSDKMIFNDADGAHEYLVKTATGFEVVKSVTTIVGEHIGPSLTDDAILEANEQGADEFATDDEILAKVVRQIDARDRAGAAGTEKHKFLESYLKGEDMSQVQGDMAQLNFAEKICSTLGIVPQSPRKEGETEDDWRARQPENVAYSEVKLFSTQGAVPYAGTMDILAHTSQGWVIADYKSTKTMDGAHRNLAEKQMWCYGKAAKELWDIDVEHYYIASEAANAIIEVKPMQEKVVNRILECEAQGLNYTEVVSEEIAKDPSVNAEKLSDATVRYNWADFQTTNANNVKKTLCEYDVEVDKAFKADPKAKTVKVNNMSITKSVSEPKPEFDDKAFLAEYGKNKDYDKYLTHYSYNPSIKYIVQNAQEVKAQYAVDDYATLKEAALASKYYEAIANERKTERDEIPTTIIDKMQEAGLYRFSYGHISATVSGAKEEVKILKAGQALLKKEHPEVYAKFEKSAQGTATSKTSIKCDPEEVKTFTPGVAEPDYEQVFDIVESKTKTAEMGK